MYDVFISHASEDKDDIARPLAERLRSVGLKIWYDEFSLVPGDSLRESIDRGLGDSRFGVVIFSPNFFAKKWTQAELNGLFTKEIITSGKTIIPVWHNITQTEVAEHSPILADRVAVLTTMGLDVVLERILATIEPGWRHKAVKGRTIALSPTSIRLHTGEWEVQTPVNIINRSEDPVYAVTIKILIYGEGVMAHSIEMDVEEQSPPIEASIGDIVVSADQLRLNCTNTEGKQIILLILHTMLARGTRTISLKGTSPINSSADVSIASFDENPRELLIKRGREFAMMFIPPEEMKVHGLSFRMKRRS
jgi:hypothetical protein